MFFARDQRFFDEPRSACCVCDTDRDKQVNGTYPGGVKIRPSFLAGASSGALSAVMLNAIIETQEKHLGTNGISMEMYKQLLFAMEDSKVFATDPLAIARIFTYNVLNGRDRLSVDPLDQKHPWRRYRLHSRH